MAEDWAELHTGLIEGLTAPEHLGKVPLLPLGPASASLGDVKELSAAERFLYQSAVPKVQPEQIRAFQGDDSLKTFASSVGEQYQKTMIEAGAPEETIQGFRPEVEKEAFRRAQKFALEKMARPPGSSTLWGKHTPFTGAHTAELKMEEFNTSAQQIKEGSGTLAAYQFVADHLAGLDEESKRGWWTQLGHSGAALVSFGIEAATSGKLIAGGLKQGVTRAGAGKLIGEGFKPLVESAIHGGGTLGSFVKGGSQVAAGRALQGGAVATGLTLGTPSHFLNDYTQRQESVLGLDKEGNLAVAEPESPAASAWKAAQSSFIDNSIMPGVAGAFTKDMAGGYAKRVFKKTVMALAGVEAAGETKRALGLSPEGSHGRDLAEAYASGDPEQIQHALQRAAITLVTIGGLEAVVQAGHARQRQGLKFTDEDRVAGDLANGVLVQPLRTVEQMDEMLAARQRQEGLDYLNWQREKLPTAGFPGGIGRGFQGEGGPGGRIGGVGRRQPPPEPPTAGVLQTSPEPPGAGRGTPAPPPPSSAPAPPLGFREAIGQDIKTAFNTMKGGAVSEQLYQGLFEALRQGRSVHAGIRDPVLARAKSFFEKGLIRSPEELKRLVEAGYDPVAAGLTAPEPPGTSGTPEPPVAGVPRTPPEPPGTPGAAPEALVAPEASQVVPGATGTPAASQQRQTAFLQDVLGKSTLPQYMKDNVQTLTEQAIRTGLASRIEELAAQGQVAKEIAETLGIDRQEVVTIRVGLGIPSQTEAPTWKGLGSAPNPKFAVWRDQYLASQRNLQAPSAPTGGVPEVAGQPVTETAVPGREQTGVPGYTLQEVPAKPALPGQLRESEQPAPPLLGRKPTASLPGEPPLAPPQPPRSAEETTALFRQEQGQQQSIPYQRGMGRPTREKPLPGQLGESSVGPAGPLLSAAEKGQLTRLKNDADFMARADEVGLSAENLHARALDQLQSTNNTIDAINDFRDELMADLKRTGLSRQKITATLAAGGDVADLPGLDSTAANKLESLGGVRRGEKATDALARVVSEKRQPRLTRAEMYENVLREREADVLAVRDQLKTEVEQANAELAKAGEEPLAPADHAEIDRAWHAALETEEAARPETGDASFNFGAGSESAPGGSTPGEAASSLGKQPLPGQLRESGPSPQPGKPEGRVNWIAEVSRNFLQDEGGALVDPRDPVFKAKVKGGWERAVRAYRFFADGMRRIAQEQYPAITRLDRDAGEATARMGNSAMYGKDLGAVLTDKTYGVKPDPVHETLVGWTIGETRQRRQRQRLLDQAQEFEDNADHSGAKKLRKEAAEVATFIGVDRSPLKTEADYQAALKDPRVNATREARKKTIVPQLDENYARGKGVLDSDSLDENSQLPGETINYRHIDEATGTAPPEGVGGAGPLNLQQKSNRYARRASLASTDYEFDIRKLDQLALEHTTRSAADADAIRALRAAGLGYADRSRNAREGYKEVPNVFPPRETPLSARGDTSFYVKDTVYEEFMHARDAYPKEGWKTGVAIGMTLPNAAALVSTQEFVTHGGNQLGALAAVGVNPKKLFETLGEQRQGDMTFREDLLKLAKVGAKRPSGKEVHSWSDPVGSLLTAIPTGKVLHKMDDVMRVMLKRSYDYLVSVGRAPDTETGLRNYVNGWMGNYDRKSQSGVVRFLRETQIGAFATAATTMTVRAAKVVGGLGGASIESPTWKAFVQNRAEMLGKVAGSLAGVAALNYAIWGNPLGDENTPLFGVKVGADKSTGKTIAIDWGAISGLNRGSRVIGAMAAAIGWRRGRTSGAIKDDAARDMSHYLMHPAIGPGVSTLITASTGHNVVGQKLAEEPGYGESKLGKNLMAALKNVSPPVAALAGYDRPGQDPPWYERVSRLAGQFGPRFRGGKPPELDNFYEAMRAEEGAFLENVRERRRQGLRPSPGASRMADLFTGPAQQINQLTLRLNHQPPPSPEEQERLRGQQAAIAKRTMERYERIRERRGEKTPAH